MGSAACAFTLVFGMGVSLPAAHRPATVGTIPSDLDGTERGSWPL